MTTTLTKLASIPAVQSASNAPDTSSPQALELHQLKAAIATREARLEELNTKGWTLSTPERQEKRDLSEQLARLRAEPRLVSTQEPTESRSLGERLLKPGLPVTPLLANYVAPAVRKIADALSNELAPKLDEGSKVT
jgi:hypothetical protein